MAIALSAPRATELKPRIVVFGIGGAGGNAVNNMIEAGLEGVEFVVANTDAQQLQFAKTDRRIQLGVTTTQGLGAGAHPEVGMSAAEESSPEIGEHLDGAHMVFITAGMGGGTGTGAAPIIAKCARERGILTVGVVTKPFHFEGRHRMRLADAGIAELQRYVDTLIVIPNQNLFRVANERTTFAEAFGMADQVLHSGVRSITDLMVLPGLINLDFADVRTVMTEMGKAMMGTGEATGEDRALMAAQNAIQNPLLDEVSLKGAKAVLVNTGLTWMVCTSPRQPFSCEWTTSKPRRVASEVIAAYQSWLSQRGLRSGLGMWWYVTPGHWWPISCANTWISWRAASCSTSRIE